MAYRLSSFEPEDGSGILTLPAYNQTDDISPAPPQFRWVKLPGGGVHDAWGSEEAPGSKQVLKKKCTLHTDTKPGLQPALDSLKSLSGKRGKLYMLMFDNTTRWRWARFAMQGSWPSLKPYQVDVDLAFESGDPLWRGAFHSQSVDLVTSPQTIILNNGGNAAVTNEVVTLTIPATAGQITAFILSMAGVSEFTWNGSLTGGDELVIDCGAWSVRKNGVGAWSSNPFSNNHKIEAILRLAPGDNGVQFTVSPSAGLPTDVVSGMATGVLGAATYTDGFSVDKVNIQFDYYDLWK